MIDNPAKTEQLIADMKASLPIECRLSQHLIRTLATQSPDLAIPDRCSISSISYAGDEGGIMCAVKIAGTQTETSHHISITHLVFNQRLPMFRQIDAYQRHRIKKIRQQAGRED
jgi:hypothetical protein